MGDLSSETPTSRQSLYFVNGAVDFIFIGGFSLVAFTVFFFVPIPTGGETIFALATLLLWVGNFPHFAASTCRLYDCRDNIRQYPMTSLVVPWIMLAGIAASFAAPDRIAPYWVKLYAVWSPYHFGAQSIGITMIYARRGGFLIGRLERLALSWFVYGTCLTRLLRLEIGAQTERYYGIIYPSFGLPEWRLPGRDQFLLVDLADAIMYAAGALLIVLFALRWLRRGERLPLILLVPALAQYVWFVGSADAQSYRYFVPLFHSVQYLFIAWAVRLKGRLDRDQVVPSRRFVLGESLRWAVLILLGGAILFYGLPYVAHLATAMSLAVATGIFTAGVQIHHFFVDGVIWKLRTKSVASPLMVNLDDLMRASPRAAMPVVAA